MDFLAPITKTEVVKTVNSLFKRLFGLGILSGIMILLVTVEKSNMTQVLASYTDNVRDINIGDWSRTRVVPSPFVYRVIVSTI